MSYAFIHTNLALPVCRMPDQYTVCHVPYFLQKIAPYAVIPRSGNNFTALLLTMHSPLSNTPVVRSSHAHFTSYNLITNKGQIILHTLEIPPMRLQATGQEIYCLLISIFKHNIGPQPQIDNPRTRVNFGLAIDTFAQIVSSCGGIAFLLLFEQRFH